MVSSETLIQVGNASFTLADILMIVTGLSLFLLVLTLWLVWRGQKQRQYELGESLRRTSEMEYRLAEMTGSLRNFADQSQGAQAHLVRTLDERLAHMGQNVGLGLSAQAEASAKSLNQLYERLAVIDSAQQNLTALSTDMLSLHDILANKQARGAYGQGRMEAIIRDGLPARAYSFQPTLSNGTRPDCLIRLPDSQLSLVIDAKFPLEAFNAVRKAASEAEALAAAAQLRRDVGRHVKDIADKYLINGETQETAIMFVPSEAIYADLYEKYEDVIQRAYRARVIMASPNVLMLLVQTMQAVIKDSAMREQAHVIKVEVVRLLEDVDRLKDRVTDLQKHFGSATSDLEKLAISADKIVKRGLRIESLDVDEAATASSLPEATPAPVPPVRVFVRDGTSSGAA